MVTILRRPDAGRAARDGSRGGVEQAGWRTATRRGRAGRVAAAETAVDDRDVQAGNVVALEAVDSDAMQIAHNKLDPAETITCDALGRVLVALAVQAACGAQPGWASRRATRRRKARRRWTRRSARPTRRLFPEGIDPQHAPLHDLIRRRLPVSQMTAARIRRTTWKLSAPGVSGEPVRLEARAGSWSPRVPPGAASGVCG